MSGTATLVEVVLTLPESKRPAWRALPAATVLSELAALPAEHGRLELTENKRSVTARAFFCVEAERWAERLIDAFRAAAPLGASGKGISFLLVDYQREEGQALTIAEGASALEKLPARKARAKHAALDALLERCVMPPPEPIAASDSRLEEACQTALAKLRALPADEVEAAWQHVKSTTITNAAFAVTKKQEKQLLTLVDTPPAHWEWAKVLPLRMIFPREREAMDVVVRELLGSATLKQQEHWMLMESLAESSHDAALATLVEALSGEYFLANAARGGLARSIHPRATETIHELASEWLTRALAKPELIDPPANVYVPGMRAHEATGILGLLEIRGCDAMMLTLWQRLYEARARLPWGAASFAVQVARAYVTSASRALEPAIAAPLLQRFPHPRVTLDEARAAIDALHERVPAAL